MMLAWLGSNQSLWTWLSLDILLHFALFAWVCYHCLKTRREATSALLWIFVAWSFPLIGPLLYALFGINRMPRRVWRKQRADHRLLTVRQAREDEALPMAYWRAVHTNSAAEPDDAAGQEIHCCLNRLLPDYPLLSGNRIQPLVDGDEAFPAMRAAIQRARHHVHLQTFIIGNDATGRDFLDLLAAKARAGVTVRLLYDRFGSTHAVLGDLFGPYLQVPNLQIAGWTLANLWKRQFQVNLRNHRKILVVDGREAFTGGINLQDDDVTQPGAPAIRDYHVHLAGPIVQELQYSFVRDWHSMTAEDPEILLQESYFPHLTPAGPAHIRVANGEPTSEGMNILSDVFFESIGAARRQLLAVTPYFVPQPDIVHAFRSAAQRGVDVRLIVPQANNHVYAGLAGRSLYEDLLKAGVRIFERQPPFMHAKALIVDDVLAVVGSANLDVRSLRLNYETNLAVFDSAFIEELRRIVLRDQAAGAEVLLNTWQNRPTYRRLLENFCYLLSPML